MAFGSGNSISLWNLFEGKHHSILNGHLDLVNCLAIAKNNAILVSGSEDRTVRIWDLKHGTNNIVLMGHTKAILCITLTSNNQYAVSGSADSTGR